MTHRLTVKDSELIATLDSISDAIGRGAEPSPEQMKELKELDKDRGRRVVTLEQKGDVLTIRPTLRLKALAAEIVALVPESLDPPPGKQQ